MFIDVLGKTHSWYLKITCHKSFFCSDDVFFIPLADSNSKCTNGNFLIYFFSIFGAHGWLSCPCGSELFMMSLLIKVP